MVKFPEAEARKFMNIFVCKDCKAKVRASSNKLAQGKVKCRSCGGRSFRAVKRK